MLKSYHSIIIPDKRIIENWYYNLDESVKPIMVNIDDYSIELRYMLLDCILLLDVENIISIIINHCSLLKYRSPNMKLIKYNGSILDFSNKNVTKEEIYLFLR